MRSRYLMIAAVAAVALLVYANSLWNGFAYDDAFIILHNTRVHHLHDLRAILLTPYWPSMGSELGLYRPLAIFAFAVEWALSGGAPWFFHLVNVLLHATVSVLAFLLIERLVNTRAAFAGALLFAVHPLHVEAIANVVGQNELWAAASVLLACLLYSSRPQGMRVPTRTMLAVLVLYGFALLVKESAVVLPGLLVLLDFYQRRVRWELRSLRVYVGDVAFMLLLCVVVLLAYLALRFSVLGNITGVYAAPNLPHLREHFRVLNAIRAWPEYVRLLFVPLHLSVDYSPGVILPVESLTPMVLLGLLLLVATLALALATPWHARPGLVAGWFLLCVLPVSNLLFPIGVVVAERTLYLPSFAVCLLAGLAFDAALNSAQAKDRRLVFALGVIVLAVFGGRAIVRNPDWKSLQTVYISLLRDHPESYKAQWALATTAWSGGQPQRAEQYFLLSERIWQRDSQLLADIGNFYIGRGNFPKAIAYLERSDSMFPFVLRTKELLAYAYAYGDRPQLALRFVHEAQHMAGADPAFDHAIAAKAYDELQRYDEAAGAWTAAVHRHDKLWLIWAMLARSLASGGHKQQALAALDSAAKRAQKPRSQDVVQKIRAAVNTNCYPAGGSCDPLVGWVMLGQAPVFLKDGK